MTINFTQQVYELTGLAIPILLIGVPVLYWMCQKEISNGNFKNLVWILAIIYFGSFAIFQTNPFFIGVAVLLIALPVIKKILIK